MLSGTLLLSMLFSPLSLGAPSVHGDSTGLERAFTRGPEWLRLKCQANQQCQNCVQTGQRQEKIREEIKKHVKSYIALALAARSAQNNISDSLLSHQGQLVTSAAASSNSAAAATSAQAAHA